jgi:dolichyl-phosphate beta-glucosyltransferase
MSASWVHLVIPAYNEGRRLPSYLPRLCEALSKTAHAWRVTVVDDGSRDSESRKMRECVQRCGPHVDFHHLSTNEGKGAAVYAGWNQDSQSEWLGLLDADGSIPPHEVVRLLSFLEDDKAPDALFCSRCKILGRTVQRSWLRHLGGRLFATFVCVTTGIPVYDSQCGFKLVRRECYEAIKGRLYEKRFAFDVELLVALTDAGAKVIEFPIDWFDVPGSKVHFFRESLRMFAALIAIQMKHSGR